MGSTANNIDEVSLWDLRTYFGCSVDPDEVENLVCQRINRSGESHLSSSQILNFLQNDTKWISLPYTLPKSVPLVS